MQAFYKASTTPMQKPSQMPSQTAHSLLGGFLQYLQDERRFSAYTVRNYKKAIQVLFTWLKLPEDGSLEPVLSLRTAQVRAFVIEQQRQLSRRTIHHYVSALRSFYRYLMREGLVTKNPSLGLVLPKLDKKLPKFLTEKQMALLLEGPKKRLAAGELSPFESARDALVLELLYGGGLRVSEAAGLTYANLDPDHQALRISGKGNKERLCPIGPVAWKALDAFRSVLPFELTPASLVLIQSNGQALGVRGIQTMLKVYLKLAQLPFDITPHTLRHSYATHLLNRGLDIRILQKLLGHSSLSATQVYTHLDMHHLKKIHHLAHPRA